jgi:unconventional prefoldin RPB5 interactor 1
MASRSDPSDVAGFHSSPLPKQNTYGTVRRLSDAISEEGADKASKQLREAISQQQGQLAELQRFSEENKSLSKMVMELPDSVSHRIMVPFGKAAFFPGSLIHTNEFLVLLGESHYAERSAKQTVEVLERRGEFLDEKISSTKAQVADLQAEHSFVINTADEAKAGLVEIREEYEGSEQIQPNPPSTSSITGEGSQFGFRADLEAKASGSNSVGAAHDREHDQLMARLLELEMAEAAAEVDGEEEDSDEEVDDESSPDVLGPFRSNPRSSQVFRSQNDLLEEKSGSESEEEEEEEDDEDRQSANSDDEEYEVEDTETSSNEKTSVNDVDKGKHGDSRPGEEQTPGRIEGRPLSRFAREVQAKQEALQPRSISHRVTFQQGSSSKQELQSVGTSDLLSTTLDSREGMLGFGLQTAPKAKVKEQSSAEPAYVNKPQVQEARQSRPNSKFKMRQAQEGRR